MNILEAGALPTATTFVEMGAILAAVGYILYMRRRSRKVEVGIWISLAPFFVGLVALGLWAVLL
jgi:hypothetical protein